MTRLISKETGDICPLPYPDEVQIVSFVDDITIICNHKDKNELIQQALAISNQRCRAVGLKISVDKTKFVKYTANRHKEKPQFKL